MSRRAIGVIAALLLPPTAAAQTAGPAQQDTPVLARAVQRGEMLSAEDFTVEARPPAAARGAVPVSAATGMEALRAMGPGTVVRVTDLVTPRLVRRGEPVLIAYRVAGLTITTRGRALASAGAGEPVRVVANATQRTLDGFVAPDGSVRIGN